MSAPMVTVVDPVKATCCPLSTWYHPLVALAWVSVMSRVLVVKVPPLGDSVIVGCWASETSFHVVPGSATEPLLSAEAGEEA
jgi:hypothetical protein